MKKSVKDEMRELMEHNKKMQQQLERVLMYKQLQKLKDEQKNLIELNKPQIVAEEIISETKQQKQAVKFTKDLEKRLEDMDKKIKQQTKNSTKQQAIKLPEAFIGNNLMDFLSMVGLSKFYEKFVDNDLNTLVDIKKSKKQLLDSMGIPLLDQIKIFKKLRAMGVK